MAARLASSERWEVITSLAGRVRDPRLPEGDVRIGGFGGVDGLSRWLEVNGVGAVLDATHPFAAQISRNAVDACARSAVPYAMFRRPPWQAQSGDTWVSARDLDHAAQLLSAHGSRVFLTIGRQGVAAFANDARASFLIRSIDPPSGPTPLHAEILLARGPFDVESEIDLLRARSIDVVVTKNSGGGQTYAKIEAARRLSIPVIMVQRPEIASDVVVFDSSWSAAGWLDDVK